MTWNSSWPIGSVSVRANKATGQQNTTYIEQTLGNDTVVGNAKDHMWNVSATKDGYHKKVSMINQTSHLTPPTVDMNIVLYSKVPSATVPDSQFFVKNTTQDRYQLSPSFKQGTTSVDGTYSTITSVPANTYGEIFMWRTAIGKNNMQYGVFRSDGTEVEAWGTYLGVEGSSATLNLKFGNGADGAGNFNIRVRNESASSTHTWNYRITYRAITN